MEETHNDGQTDEQEKWLPCDSDYDRDGYSDSHDYDEIGFTTFRRARNLSLAEAVQGYSRSLNVNGQLLAEAWTVLGVEVKAMLGSF